nr:DUF3160 domain-containing protein [Anaerolineae bacterium]
MNRNQLRTLCACFMLLLCLSSLGGSKIAPRGLPNPRFWPGSGACPEPRPEPSRRACRGDPGRAKSDLLSPVAATAPGGLRTEVAGWIHSESPEAADSSFELPDNLPIVESIHPLDDAAKARLRASGLVALPDQDIERLSDAYMRLFGEERVSVFITSDVALHLFHNVFDDLLAEVERAHLYDDVEWLVEQFYAASAARYAATPETQPLCKAAARHDMLVFAVAARLLDDSFVFPEVIEPDASQYVQKVLDHAVTEFYPGDDYTQYEPRGHYAGDEQLERYFRAVKWLGRRIFRIEDRYYPDDADVELTAAALLAQLMADDPAMEARWNRVYDVTRLLAGPADSITPPMVQQALDNVFGSSFTLEMLEDAANRALLRTEFQRDVYPTSEII